MQPIAYLALILALVAAVAQGQEQRTLRRVIKSTPTASHLARVRLVTVRSASAEPGAVSQISSREAASFGQRSSTNETQATQSATKAKPQASTTTTTSTSTTTTTSAPSTTRVSASTSTTTTTTTAASTSGENKNKNKASERQVAPQAEVELLSSAPSSWQMMTAVEAPAAALIAAGTRPAQPTSDLATAGSSLQSSDESSDFLRSSSSATKGSYTQRSSNSETFSRLRQQQASKQQQSFFYPQQQQQVRASGKTSNYQGTKTHWYQPTTTTQRPAPLVQEQQYEQQNEQYVEQQQQVEYGAAPLGQAEPFAFDFKTQDNSGNGQYRKEESDKNGVVRGSYGYTDANGIYRHVEYVADQNGFRANIKSNEPGLIGETQPASIRLDGGPAPARLSAPNSNIENSDWASSGNDGSSPAAESAVAPPDFESSHKSERIRAPRYSRI